MSRDIFGLHSWSRGDATGSRWIEVEDAAQRPAANRVTPTAKNDLAPNVSGATAEKSCSLLYVVGEKI